MVWQRAGTVAVQNGSNTVVGTNVDFASSSRIGDSFIGPDGVSYELANVASSTVISILPAYKGPTVIGAAYAIMPVQGYDKMLSDAFNNLNNQFGQKLAALGTTGNYEILPVSKGGTGGDTQAKAQLALGIPTSDAPLSVARGGTGGTALGSAAKADVAISLTDKTAGRLMPVGYAGLGSDLAPFPGASATDFTVPTGFYSVGSSVSGMPYAGFWGLRVERLFGNYCLQDAWDINSGGARYFRLANNGSAGVWKPYTASGANSDITSLSGLTTALSVSQGGTGGKTQADARTGLGLGTAATATIGTAAGNVMPVGAGGLLGVAIGIPQGTALSLVQKTQFSTTNNNADVPTAAPYSTLITIKYPEGSRQSELASNILDGSLYSRVILANGGQTSWRKIYDDTNTTRAADGTLKAI